MLALVLHAITLLACLALAGRLLLFRRGRRRHCLRWALLAWLLINISLAYALFLALAGPAGGRWYLTALLVAAAWQAFRARGNAAKLMRLRP